MREKNGARASNAKPLKEPMLTMWELNELLDHQNKQYPSYEEYQLIKEHQNDQQN